MIVWLIHDPTFKQGLTYSRVSYTCFIIITCRERYTDSSYFFSDESGVKIEIV